MNLHARVTVERKIIINGVEFEDITLSQLDAMIADTVDEIAALKRSRDELVELHSEKSGG